MRSTIVILVLSATLFSGNSAAMLRNEHLGDIFVSVEGAARTKKVFIESLVQNCIKREEYTDWQSVDPQAMEQCLRNTRLFSSAEVQVREPEIFVRISDRWTLIPIPNIYAGGGKSSFGGFIFESNFLGYGKTVGIGGATATEGNSFSLIYMDNAISFTDYTLRIFARRSSDDNEAYDEETVIYGYKMVDDSFTIVPGYRITQNLEASFSLNYSNREFRQLDLFSPVPQDYHSWSVGAGISYKRSDYKLFYNDGFSARIKWIGQATRSDSQEKTSSLSTRLAWDKLIFEKHALQLELQGEYRMDATEADVSMFGRGKGYRGIEPNGLWTSRIVSGSADYQIPLFKRKHGFFTAAPFMDYGIYKSYFDGGSDGYLAYGIGAYYYVNFINLPGLGLAIGKNDDFMGEYVSIRIGMDFQ